jgi:hypothetical protein
VYHCDGSQLDEAIEHLIDQADSFVASKIKNRNNLPPSTKELAVGLNAIKPQLKDEQIKIIANHYKSVGRTALIAKLRFRGDYRTVDAALEDYIDIAQRLCDEIGYAPVIEQACSYPCLAILLDLAASDLNGPSSILVMRNDLAESLEYLHW